MMMEYVGGPERGRRWAEGLAGFFFCAKHSASECPVDLWNEQNFAFFGARERDSRRADMTVEVGS